MSNRLPGTDTPDRSYDAVIVGAGLAGSAVAGRLADEGLSVLVLEREDEIGIPVRCAEAVSQQGLEEFVDPRPEWIAARVHRAHLVSSRGEKCELLFRDRGYVLERRLFVRDLAIQAASRGVQFLVAARAERLTTRNGRATGVRCWWRGQQIDIGARAVILAAGVGCTLGRDIGMKTQVSRGSIYSCAQYVVTGIDVPTDCLEFHLGRETAPAGYAWVFPKRKDLANVGLGIPQAVGNGGYPVDYLDRFLERRFPSARAVEFRVGGVPLWDGTNDLVRGNVVAVGDAARLADPLTGAGIVTALESGALAAGALKAYLRESERPETLLSYRREWLARHRELRYHLAVRNACQRASDEDFKELIKGLSRFAEGRDLIDLTSLEIMSGVLRAAPRLLTLVPRLAGLVRASG